MKNGMNDIFCVCFCFCWDVGVCVWVWVCGCVNEVCMEVIGCGVGVLGWGGCKLGVWVGETSGIVYANILHEYLSFGKLLFKFNFIEISP